MVKDLYNNNMFSLSVSAEKLYYPVSDKGDDMAIKKKSDLLPILALLGAVFLWSSSFVGMRIALKEMTPMQVTWIRMVVALLAVSPFLPRLRRLPYEKGDLFKIVGMVLFLPCAYYLLESNALKFTTSSQAGVISSVVPLFVGLLSWLFLKERISLMATVGLVISIAGVIWLTLAGSDDAKATDPILGNSLELGAMVCAACSMVMLKNLSSRYSSFDLTIFQVIAGCIFFIRGGVSLFDEGFHVSLIPLSATIYMGIFVTLGAFGLYNWAMSRVEAAKASTYINLIPVFAVMLGWMILDEGLNPIQLIAGGVILFGIWLSSTK